MTTFPVILHFVYSTSFMRGLYPVNLNSAPFSFPPVTVLNPKVIQALCRYVNKPTFIFPSLDLNSTIPHPSLLQPEWPHSYLLSFSVCVAGRSLGICGINGKLWMVELVTTNLINNKYVRHVTGNDQDYLRKIPRAAVQISALL